MSHFAPRQIGYSPAVSWLVAIFALSILVIVHEYGHYICARIGGMHVDRFSVIGIGPPILRLFEYRGTEFVISAVPFGAYVHIVGMESEDPDHPVPVRRPRWRNPLGSFSAMIWAL